MLVLVLRCCASRHDCDLLLHACQPSAHMLHPIPNSTGFARGRCEL